MIVTGGDDRLKPRLVLRFGISGHRPPRLAEEQFEAIYAECQRLFTLARDELAKIHARHSEVFSAADPLLELVTPLAAGADTIASEAARAAGVPLAAAFPMPGEHYRSGFSDKQWARAEDLFESAETRFVLDSGQMADDHAFELIGRLVVAQSDILIAVWDGDDAHGRGGTTQILAEAVAEHMPVIHIDASGQEPSMLLWSGVEEIVPDRPSLGGVGRTEAIAALPALISALTAPPITGDEARGLRRFLSEKPSVRHRAFSWPLLLVGAGTRTLASVRFRGPTTQECSETMEPLIAPVKEHGSFGKFLSGPFLYRFARADADGNSYALRFRSSFVRNFALSALAVLLALSGLLWPEGKIFLISAELAVIFAIIVNTHRANRKGLHRAWLDHRHLAERLRLLALPAMLGQLSLRDVEDGTRQPGWISWYSRASARELGLIEGRCDRAYLESLRASAIKLLDDQTEYHRHTRVSMKAADHRLHLYGDALFGLTIITCAIWLALKLWQGSAVIAGLELTNAVTFATALFPALAASLYGIRMQGDFAATAERSDMFAKRLHQLKLAIEREPLSYTRLSQRLHRLGEIMLSDVQQWRSSYQTRPLSLPG